MGAAHRRRTIWLSEGAFDNEREPPPGTAEQMPSGRERGRRAPCQLRWQADRTLPPDRSRPNGGRRGKRRTMTIGVAHLSPLLSIIVGVLILIMPRFLNYFVAIYLIVVGLLGLGVGR